MKTKMCGFCGKEFTGKSFPVHDENFRKQNIYQCEDCYVESLGVTEEDKTPCPYTLSDLKEAFEAGTYWNGKYHKQQDMIGSDPMKVPDFEKWFEEFKSK